MLHMADLSSCTDHQIAALLSAGSEVAFKHLYDKYWTKLYYVAAKKLDSTSEAEEVVQDIFMALWRKRENFQLKTAFENYFATAVKFEVFKRRAARIKQTSIATDDLVQENYSNGYDVQLLKNKLEETLNSLPPKCRLVFTLSRETELTNKQIAADLNISEKAVEKHITTALKIFKLKFGQYLVLIFILKGWL